MTGRLAPDRIELDFLSALERLTQGTPKHRDLKKAAAAGRLKVNISSVAKEAGRSRTLIGIEACRYPHVRAQVLGYIPTPRAARTATEAIATLRATAADLRRERDQALAEAVSHFHARQRAERQARKWKEAYRRLQSGRPVWPSPNVVNLIPPESESD